MVQVRDISFEAPGGGSPTTWGQRAIWQPMVWLAQESYVFNLRRVLTVPPNRTIDEVADALRALVQRHPGLRTRFPDYDTAPTQEVAGSGTVRLTVHHVTADAAERVAADVAKQWQAQCFDHEREWPVRLALVCADGLPSSLVVVASHLIVDGAGWLVLMGECQQLLDGQALPPDDKTWGPLALAAYEQSPDGQAVHAAAVRYWRSEMSQEPSSILDFPCVPLERSTFVGLRMSSVALADAAVVIARVQRCSTSSVLLAAVAALLGHYTGHSRIPALLASQNRWRPEVLRAVASVTQGGLFSVTLGRMTFADLVSLTWRRALVCIQHAAYDQLAMESVIDDVTRQRGAWFDRKIIFNDVRVVDGWPARSANARGRTTIESTGQWDQLAQRFGVYVRDTDDRATLDLEVDTAYFPVPVARRLLEGIEALVVHAAQHPVQLDEVAAITGVVPAARGTDWLRVARTGWVDLVEATKLVVDAPGVAQGAVFVEPDADGAGRLTAFVVPESTEFQPEWLHAELCSRIRWRTDVIAPHHYVFCASAPSDGSLAGWRARPVLTAGTGRS